MSRRKIPEYFYKFEIECNGYGNTPEQAKEQLLEDIDYKGRWIKGNLVDSSEVAVHEIFTGSKSFRATRTLYFGRVNRRTASFSLEEMALSR